MNSVPTESSGRNVQYADEPPPILGSWGRVYAAVLGFLGLLILLMLLFMHTFA